MRTSNNTIMNKASDAIHRFCEMHMRDYVIDSMNLEVTGEDKCFKCWNVRVMVSFFGDEEPWEYMVSVPFDGRKRVCVY